MTLDERLDAVRADKATIQARADAIIAQGKALTDELNALAITMEQARGAEALLESLIAEAAQ